MFGHELLQTLGVVGSWEQPQRPPAIEHPDLAPIATAAFAGAVGLDPDPIDLSDNNGAAWISVLGVTPAKERALDDVKPDVKAAWTEAALRRELAALASILAERLSKGESAAAIAKDAAGKVETTGAITRNTSPPGLTAGGVQVAFTLPNGGAQSAPTADGKSRTVFRVTQINVPQPPSKPQADQIKQELTQEMQQDVLNTYVDGLQKQIGVHLNNEVLQQVLSGGRPGR